MPFFYIDSYYLLLVLPALIFSLIAQYKVNSTFKKYSTVRNARGMTGAEAARRVLQSGGAVGVTVKGVAGQLTDHYNPKDNSISLSEPVLDQSSVAAVGVAAHEAGHALQYAENYFPIRIRTLIIPLTNFGSTLAIPLVLFGILLSLPFLSTLGLFFFFFAVLFQLITLPVEFNASRRAMQALENTGVLSNEELKGAKKVLTAAALTYVAALAVSLANFLRLLMIVKGNDRRR